LVYGKPKNLRMMKNPKKNFVIKKVPLNTFIDLLNNLYMDGADFVDLHGEVDGTGTQDNIKVSVPMDYMSEEAQREMGPAQPPPGVEEEEEQGPLTEEEVKELVNHA
jgi:hypothetical protein